MVTGEKAGQPDGGFEDGPAVGPAEASWRLLGNCLVGFGECRLLRQFDGGGLATASIEDGGGDTQMAIAVTSLRARF